MDLMCYIMKIYNYCVSSLNFKNNLFIKMSNITRRSSLRGTDVTVLLSLDVVDRVSEILSLYLYNVLQEMLTTQRVLTHRSKEVHCH